MLNTWSFYICIHFNPLQEIMGSLNSIAPIQGSIQQVQIFHKWRGLVATESLYAYPNWYRAFDLIQKVS